MPPRQIGELIEGFPPFLQLDVIVDPLLKFSQCFSKAFDLMAYMRRIQLVKHGQNHLFVFLLTLKDLYQLVQAQRGRRVVLREYNDRNPRVFDGFDKWWRDFLSSSELVVINEGVEPSLMQSVA
jgi:hypothetical protein